MAQMQTQRSDMPVEWIAVDWGTSNLRVWMMRADGSVLAQDSSAKGMGTLTPDAFEPALLDLIAPYLAQDRVMPVLCTGMVGARQGWIEAPYVATPCSVTGGGGSVDAPTQNPHIAVRILPGVKQTAPPDVMRGEETQIAGLLGLHPDFDGVVCMPGTHTKWVHISAGEIVSFQTFMTGEMFALLSQNSVLRHSVISDEWDAEAFLAAVDGAMGRPQSVAAHLFSLRASGLLFDTPPQTARARLSGLLIGSELGGARPYWLGRHVAILGADALSAHYRVALGAQGVTA
ncbi:MAG: 2-dehydro-3-deoxygalactonokinase, partial [Sulfitobacter sp.]